MLVWRTLAPSLVVCSGALLLFLILAGCTATTSELSGSEADSLCRSIRELRSNGHYAQALELGRRLQQMRRQDRSAESWKCKDADNLVATLEQVTGLPEEAQGELAQADRLTAVIDEQKERGEYSAAIEAAQQELDIRSRYLGEEHIEVARNLTMLATLHHLRGEYTTAQSLSERALRISEKILGSGHPDVAQALSNLGLVFHATGDNERAQAMHERALRIRENALGPEHRDVAGSLNNLGISFYATGDYKRAQAMHERALRIRERVLGPDHFAVSQTLNNLALVFWKTGEYQRARSLYERTLRIREKILGPEHPSLARTLSNLAILLVSLGEYESALPMHERALAIREETLGPGHPDVAQSLNNLAFLLMKMGDYQAARSMYEKALEVRQEAFGPEHLNVALSLSNLAFLFTKSGDYVRARSLHERALAIREKALGPEHPDVAQSLNDLGLLLWETGDYDAARPMYEGSLKIIEKALGPGHAGVATRLNNLALLLLDAGDYDAARPLFERALAIYEKSLGPEHPDVGTTLNNLALLHERTREYGAARRMYERTLEIKEKAVGTDHPLLIATLRGLAGVSWRGGDYARARRLYDRSLRIAERYLGLEHPETATTLRELALLLWDSDDVARALPLLQRSASVFEVARLRAEAGVGRASILASPYPELAAACLELGQADQAWPWVERALGRVLADLLMVSNGRSLSPAESAREDSLKRTLARLESQLLALKTACPGRRTRESAARLMETRFQLLEAEAALKALQEHVAVKYPISEGCAIPLERVQEVLSEQSALIGWLYARRGVDEHVSWGYVIRKHRPVNWVPLNPPLQNDNDPSLVRKACDFRRALGIAASWEKRVPSAGGLSRLATEVWADWLAPLTPHLTGINNLIVVPSGPMLGLPIEALVDSQGVYLSDRYAVSYVPSATLYAWLREKGKEARGQTPRSALLLGDPPFTADHLSTMDREGQPEGTLHALIEQFPEGTTFRSALAGNPEKLAGLPRLPWTREEVRRVASVVPEATILLGADASEQALTQLGESGLLRSFDMIHLATHAIVDDAVPERSALILSRVNLPDPIEAAMANARIYDGLLTSKEVVCEWDLDADLVTLSGCQSGLGREVAGEGYFGLVHAFLQAGARSLLVSLWRTEEVATCLLMGRFYENLTGGYREDRRGGKAEPMFKAEALQEAKRWLRAYTTAEGCQPFQHPVYWSGFVLIGDL